MKTNYTLALMLLFCGWTFSKNPSNGKGNGAASSKKEWKNGDGDSTSTNQAKFSPPERQHRNQPAPPTIEDDSFMQSIESDWITGKGAGKPTEKEQWIMKTAAKKLKDKLKKYKKEYENNRKWKSKREAPSSRVIRKEFRCLTQKERQDFRDAVFKLIEDGTFHTFVAYHNIHNSPSAHFGPNFLGFHRMYTDMFEMELQRVSGNSSMALPYYDSHSEMVLGYYFTNNEYHKSCVFGGDMLGNLEGTVTTGLFAYIPNLESCSDNGNRQYNYRGGNSQRNALNFYRSSDIEIFKTYTSHKNFSVPFNRLFESRHGGAHREIGGNMKILSCAPNDIMFWLHHCFVDYLWEINKSQRDNGDTDYPSDEEIYSRNRRLQAHYANSPMKPFDSPDDRVFNIDGLSDEFTAESYQYEDPPSFRQCKQDSDCQSDFFWCDIEYNDCVTKLVAGSDVIWNTNPNDRKPYLNSIYCPPGTKVSPYWESGKYKARCV